MPGGWVGSTRRARLPANWETEIRPAVLKRDGYRCTWLMPGGIRCPAPATDVDHDQAMTDDHRIESCHSLCSVHHARKSSSEGGQAWGAMRREMAKRKFRKPEPHPGLRASTPEAS